MRLLRHLLTLALVNIHVVYSDETRTLRLRDVTSSASERYPAELELELQLDTGESQLLRLKKNIHFNDDVQIESEQNGVTKRHASSPLNVAEYLSDDAALHVSSEIAGVRYKRTVTGFVYRQDRAYLVEPVESSKRSTSDDSVHNISEIKKLETPPISSFRGTSSEYASYLNDEIIPPAWRHGASYVAKKYSRGTRLIVDVLAVIDYSLYEKMREKFADSNQDQEDKTIQYLKRYYAVTWAGIAQRYHSLSYNGMTILPRLSQIFIATTPRDDAWVNPWREGMDIHANNALGRVADWINDKKAEGKYRDIDHTMLFTNLRMYSWKNEEIKDEKNFGVVGLAFTGAICEYYSSSMIEDDLKFRSISTSAHELGHSLGARHDGPPIKSSCPANDAYLMCPWVTLGQDNTFQNQYRFSTCSLESMYEVMEELNRRNANCMADEPMQEGELKVLSMIMPGYRFDLHQQCQIYTGDKNSFYCAPNTASYMERTACRNFACQQNGQCNTYLNHHALFGTPCGLRKWCESGVCVPTPESHYHESLDRQYGVCPNYDAEQCRYTEDACNGESRAQRCCNRCLRSKLEGR